MVVLFDAHGEISYASRRKTGEPNPDFMNDLLKARKSNLAEADVKKILSLVEPERNKLVLKCK